MAKTRKARSGSKRRGMSRRMKRSMSRKGKRGGGCSCPSGGTLAGNMCWVGMGGPGSYSYQCVEDTPWYKIW